MTELFGAGWLLPTTDAVKTWTSQQSWVYAPKPESIAAALRQAFHGRGDHDARAAAAREFSLAYDVGHVFDRFWKAELAVIADLCRRRR